MARMGPPNKTLLTAGIRVPGTWVPEDERTPVERRVDEVLGEARGEDELWEDIHELAARLEREHQRTVRWPKCIWHDRCED